MESKMVVREAGSKPVNMFLGCLIAILCIIIGFAFLLFMISRSIEGQLPFAASIPLVIVFVVAISLIARSVSRSGSAKVEVSPILIINEVIPTNEANAPARAAIAAGFGLFGYLLFIITGGRIKFTLCEEGLIFGGRLHRWNSFRSFSTISEKAEFKLKKNRGTISLVTVNHFEEVRQILSKYISTSNP